MTRQDTSVAGQASHIPVMREIPAQPVPDYANMGTDELLSAFWGFMKNPLSDVAINLANVRVTGGTVPLDLGELTPLVNTALGLRKAHGRNIAPAKVTEDLAIEVPDGFVPSFTLYLQAARIRPDDAAERRLITDIKGSVRKKIRDSRK